MKRFFCAFFSQSGLMDDSAELDTQNIDFFFAHEPDGKFFSSIVRGAHSFGTQLRTHLNLLVPRIIFRVKLIYNSCQIDLFIMSNGFIFHVKFFYFSCEIDLFFMSNWFILYVKFLFFHVELLHFYLKLIYF